LRGRFARSFCQVVLGGSGDNPLDLLYNSNKPSNAIRPRGLGGTPIKKNHPKRRKLRFYPPYISYPRPLVIILKNTLIRLLSRDRAYGGSSRTTLAPFALITSFTSIRKLSLLSLVSSLSTN
jgi:hypothetical protein